MRPPSHSKGSPLSADRAAQKSPCDANGAPVTPLLPTLSVMVTDGDDMVVAHLTMPLWSRLVDRMNPRTGAKPMYHLDERDMRVSSLLSRTFAPSLPMNTYLFVTPATDWILSLV